MRGISSVSFCIVTKRDRRTEQVLNTLGNHVALTLSNLNNLVQPPGAEKSAAWNHHSALICNGEKEHSSGMCSHSHHYHQRNLHN